MLFRSVNYDSESIDAFKIDPDGKIHSSPKRLVTREDLEVCEVAGGLVDLGNGYFCVLGIESPERLQLKLMGRGIGLKKKLRMFQFKVSVSEDGENLICDESEIKVATVPLALGESINNFFAC